MTKPFLTARWVDLGLVTYRVAADLLRPWIPTGLEPDSMAGDPPDTAYVSLVAFRFLETKVRGVAVPLHTDFPEINLRAYVRETAGQRRRGVIFIAELVPRLAIATIANLLYHEHYRAVPMSVDACDDGDGRRTLTCRIDLAERTHAMTLTGRTPSIVPTEDSVEHFFKEHTWGFGRDPGGSAVTYRVEHPVWAVYPTGATDLRLDFDFGELYGSPWDVLDQLDPLHVAYAVGSEIAVYPREA